MAKGKKNKARNWKPAVEGKLCAKQFDLYSQSSGTEGWNPLTPSTEVAALFVDAAKEDHETFGPLLHFLKPSQGGHPNNKDNWKAQTNFAKAAGEYFVFLAKCGVRKGESFAALVSFLLQSR